MKKFELNFLQIEPSTICNYTCGFCAGRHMPQRHISINTFREVMDNIEGLKYISIQGEGEPLLNPQFFDMVRMVKEKHPEASISFITNGSLFTAANIRQILSLDISRIMVSIESAKSEMFKDIRGGKLEKVIKGIRALIKERESQNLGKPVIGFAVTIMKKTMKDFHEIVDLYRELNMDGGIASQYLQEMESYKSIYDPQMKAQILSQEDIEWIKEMREGDESMKELFRQADTESNFYSSLFDSTTPGCPWLAKGLFINADGVATGCCLIKDAQRDGLGKVTSLEGESTFFKRQQMQEMLLKGDVPSACTNCPVALEVQAAIRQTDSIPTEVSLK